MSRENKKLLHKQWNRNAKRTNKDVSLTDTDSEDAQHWNPVDYPVDGLELSEDYEDDDSSDDEEFEDKEGDDEQ